MCFYFLFYVKDLHLDIILIRVILIIHAEKVKTASDFTLTVNTAVLHKLLWALWLRFVHYSVYNAGLVWHCAFFLKQLRVGYVTAVMFCLFLVCWFKD